MLVYSSYVFQLNLYIGVSIAFISIAFVHKIWYWYLCNNGVFLLSISTTLSIGVTDKNPVLHYDF